MSKEDNENPTTEGKKEPEAYDPDFKGPTKKRSCTDVICLVLFISLFVGWIVVAGFAAHSGDPSRLFNPSDSRDRVCGEDPEVVNKSYLLFFDLTKCGIYSGCVTPQVCVEECPTENWYYSPDKVNETDRSKLICVEGVDPLSDPRSIEELVTGESCASYYVGSLALFRRCVPKNIASFADTLMGSIAATVPMSVSERMRTVVDAMKYVFKAAKIQEIVEGVIADIKATWWCLLLGFMLAMAVSFLWIILLKYISGFMVWFSMVAFVVLSGAGCSYTLYKYVTIGSTDNSPLIDNSTMTDNSTMIEDYILTMISNNSMIDDSVMIDYTHVILMETEAEVNEEMEKYGNGTTWLVLFIITLIIFLVILFVLIFLRKRISIAIALLGQGSKAIADTMTSLLFPVIPYIMQLIFLIIFSVVTLYLASSRKAQYRIKCPSSGCNCEGIGIMMYNIFALFWSMFFASAFGEMVLAGNFASWYWTFNKAKDLPSLPVVASCRTTVRYHVGTVAFGSLIIALVRLIRMILEYINKKAKGKTDNRFFRWLMRCCRCALWCLEKFLKFLNRNAYIYCSIHGKNFCVSAKNAFLLILRNIVRVIVLDKIADVLLFIGKMVVVGCMGVLFFFIFSGKISALNSTLPEVNYYLTPVIIMIIGTFFIAHAFFNVYSMAIDTIFLCFLTDLEINDGSEQKPYYMSKDLMKILDKKNTKLKDE